MPPEQVLDIGVPSGLPREQCCPSVRSRATRLCTYQFTKFLYRAQESPHPVARRGQVGLDVPQGCVADYLAARILLNARMPHQGAMMASTALGKYFKTFSSRGAISSTVTCRPRTGTSWSICIPNLWPNSKSYALRYTYDLPKGYTS